MVVSRSLKRLVEYSVALLLFVLLAMGCGSNKKPNGPASNGGGPAVDGDSESAAAVKFTDVASESGVEFTYYNGREGNQCLIVESLGGGAGMLDFDGDGLVDLCYPGGGKIPEENKIEPLAAGLFRNLGNMKFAAVSGLSGLSTVRHYTHGVTVGDYDSDGFPDILLTGYGGLQLWRNQGDGSFEEVQQQVGLTDTQWSSSAAWGDLNDDGHLDLYVAHYVDWSWANNPKCNSHDGKNREICPPRDFKGLPDIVYYGNGDGTFRDATREARLRADGKGLGVILCDTNNNRHLDIYVANDTVENFLYINDGAGSFQDVARPLGAASDAEGVPNGSMGVDLCDFNRDGLADIWVANYENEAFALYRNDGESGFYHMSEPTGIAALGGLFVGFGTCAVDVNRDGHEDFAVANGHVIKYPLATPLRQLPLILLGSAARFTRVEFTDKSYFATPQEGRGLAAGDLDNDGDVDLTASHLNDPVAVLRNDTECDGGWLSVRLIGVQSNRDAVGARLELKTSSGSQSRQVTGGGSYLSHSDRRVFWGVPQGDTVQKLTIHWPSGATQEIAQVELNQFTTIIESP